MTTLPVTFRASPLPLNQSYTPQQFLDAITSRLSIQSDTSFSIFTTGSTVPTSNVGPFLKDGVTWYVWDVLSGTYIPEVIEYRSLRYVASASAPNQALYTFWIELSGAGKAIAIKYYSGGAWKDVYEDKFLTYSTTAQMNTAIAAAVGAISLNQYPFRAVKSAGAQVYTGGTGDAQIVYDVESYDPSNVFSTANNRFTAPASGYYAFHASTYLTETGGGGPTLLDRQIKLRVNGNEVTNWQFQVNDDTDGVMLAVTDQRLLAAGDFVDAAIFVTSTGASTWSLLNDGTTTFFTGHRILT
jgi:hypothetical protein